MGEWLAVGGHRPWRAAGKRSAREQRAQRLEMGLFRRHPKLGRKYRELGRQWWHRIGQFASVHFFARQWHVQRSGTDRRRFGRRRIYQGWYHLEIGWNQQIGRELVQHQWCNRLRVQRLGVRCGRTLLRRRWPLEANSQWR